MEHANWMSGLEILVGNRRNRSLSKVIPNKKALFHSSVSYKHSDNNSMLALDSALLLSAYPALGADNSTLNSKP